MSILRVRKREIKRDGAMTTAKHENVICCANKGYYAHCCISSSEKPTKAKYAFKTKLF